MEYGNIPSLPFLLLPEGLCEYFFISTFLVLLFRRGAVFLIVFGGSFDSFGSFSVLPLWDYSFDSFFGFYSGCSCWSFWSFSRFLTSASSAASWLEWIGTFTSIFWYLSYLSFPIVLSLLESGFGYFLRCAVWCGFHVASFVICRHDWRWCPSQRVGEFSLGESGSSASDVVAYSAAVSWDLKWFLFGLLLWFILYFFSESCFVRGAVQVSRDALRFPVHFLED